LRARHNFDEVQPQSNANAAPFGRTLTAPGGAPRGHPGDGAPRHRSGPRAKGAFANGHARAVTGTGPYNDRGDSGPSEYNKPSGPPASQTQIRSKRTRTVVKADVAADADGVAASRAERKRIPNGES